MSDINKKNVLNNNFLSFYNNRIEQSMQQTQSRLQVYQKKLDLSDEGGLVDLAQFETGNLTTI